MAVNGIIPVVERTESHVFLQEGLLVGKPYSPVFVQEVSESDVIRRQRGGIGIIVRIAQSQDISDIDIGRKSHLGHIVRHRSAPRIFYHDGLCGGLCRKTQHQCRNGHIFFAHHLCIRF